MSTSDLCLFESGQTYSKQALHACGVRLRVSDQATKCNAPTQYLRPLNTLSDI